MKIHRTLPEESTQWQADAPSVRAMRLIMPLAALLSATSLAGGIASFFNLGLSSIIGICLIIFFAVAAWFFDGLAVSSGQSVVRDGILAWKKEIDSGLLFWINIAFASVICGAMVFGSFHMSRNGISYLVMEFRKAKEIRTQTDTLLNAAIAGATDQNAGILEAKTTAYNSQVSAINASYAGKIEALEADIERREKQRTGNNRHYIDNQISKLKKKIGEAKAEQGKELASLATEFAAEQSRILAGTEDLQKVVVGDAQAASERAKTKQQEKDTADKQLSVLVSSIFAWSVVLMLVIGLRLTMLETRNGILPNPILSNADVSGADMLLRFILTIPSFILTCLSWVSEWLYKVAPKHRTPVVDNDLVDFKSAQAQVIAIRKEGKRQLKTAAAERREIGFRKNGSGPGDGEKVGFEKPGFEEKKLANKGASFPGGGKPGSEKVGPAQEEEMSQGKRELIQQVKLSKKELTKYKKRQSASYQKILADQQAGNEPKQQTLKAYENRTEKVNELTFQIRAMEAQLKSMS